MNVGAGSLLGALCINDPDEPRTASLLRCIAMLAMMIPMTTAASMHQLLFRCLGPMVTFGDPNL
jgi:hypothetical protein